MEFITEISTPILYTEYFANSSGLDDVDELEDDLENDDDADAEDDEEFAMDDDEEDDDDDEEV
jgi:hypothetical protein